jgi:hypothetical protein
VVRISETTGLHTLLLVASVGQTQKELMRQLTKSQSLGVLECVSKVSHSIMSFSLYTTHGNFQETFAISITWRSGIWGVTAYYNLKGISRPETRIMVCVRYSVSDCDCSILLARIDRNGPRWAKDVKMAQMAEPNDDDNNCNYSHAYANTLSHTPVIILTLMLALSLWLIHLQFSTSLWFFHFFHF